MACEPTNPALGFQENVLRQSVELVLCETLTFVHCIFFLASVCSYAISTDIYHSGDLSYYCTTPPRHHATTPAAGAMVTIA